MLHCGRFMKRIISKQDGLCFLFCLVFLQRLYRIIEEQKIVIQDCSRQVSLYKNTYCFLSFFFHFSNWYCFTQLILLTKRANIVVCFLLKRHLSLFSNDEHRYQHFHVKKCINFFLDSIIGIILLEISSKSLLFCKRI